MAKTDVEARLSEFFSEADLKHLQESEENLNLMKLIFENYPTFCKETADEVMERPVIVRIKDPIIQQEWNKYIGNEGEDALRDSTFTINAFHKKNDDGDKEPTIAIFNEEWFVMSIGIKNGEFVVNEFCSDPSGSGAKALFTNNRLSNIRLRGKDFKVREMYDPWDSEYDAGDVFLYIWRLCQVPKVVKDIRAKAKSKMRESTTAFSHLRKYIEFQIKELMKAQGDGIVVAKKDVKGDASTGTTARKGIVLHINAQDVAPLRNSIVGDGEEALDVRVTDAEDPKNVYIRSANLECTDPENGLWTLSWGRDGTSKSELRKKS